MKKLIFILCFFLFSSFSNAQDSTEENSLLNKVGENFDKGCFQYYGNLDILDLKDNLKDSKYNSYKINLNSITDLKIIQDNYLLPYKKLYKEEYFTNYKNEYGIIQKDQNDDNKNTYTSIDTLDNKEVVYELENILIEKSFKFNLDYEAKQNYIDIYISLDGNNYSKVDKSNISDFDFKYIKLKFECNRDVCIREKIKIFELNFLETREVIVINSFFDKDISFFSNYNCDDKKYNQEPKSYDNFNIETNTQEIKLDLSKNTYYNPNRVKDYDNDGINDEFDNCPLVYNPEQIDTGATGTGDTCSDKDKDGIIGEKDNCILIYNPDQKDSDKNSIGDACESDSDGDKIPDTIDNCKNTHNPNQEDTDNDGVGDTCDNCKNKFNTSQEDDDKDGVGNICDEVDDRYMESNKGFFIGLLIFITMVFGIGIFFTIKKLNSKQ
ncbi:MAG: thrombospondin type 3 repeat-containing protein [Candidatus Gracilibacteria bacterium]|nr:thrombospondin type 3 repeat-containing protein [Candidatus Gracilibacteria bacterium]